MKQKEFITEWSSTNPEIISILKKKGYERLGRGVDQTAFLEPGTGQVLKIFGTKPGTGTNRYTPDQEMFIFFANFCKNNSTNPFLPRFSGWETFDFKGRKYLQIRMEQLGKVPPFMAAALEDLASDNKDDPVWAERYHKARADALGNNQDWVQQDEEDPFRIAHNELAVLLGKQYDMLLRTLKKIHALGSSHRWINDLHEHNFMIRADGTPVIVDPWVVAKY